MVIPTSRSIAKVLSLAGASTHLALAAFPDSAATPFPPDDALPGGSLLESQRVPARLTLEGASTGSSQLPSFPNGISYDLQGAEITLSNRLSASGVDVASPTPPSERFKAFATSPTGFEDSLSQQESPKDGFWVHLFAVVGVAAAFRGIIKASYATHLWRKARLDYLKWTSVSPPAIDLEIFKEAESGAPVMKTRTAGQIDLHSLIPNMAVRHMFESARRLCTPEQPFPYEVLRRRKRLHFLPTRGINDPTSAIQIINKSLRERISKHSKDGHDDDQFGLPVKEMVRFAIPIVEVKANGSRDESIILISGEDFCRFGDPGSIQALRVNNPKQEARISILEQAFRLHREVLADLGKDPSEHYHYQPDGERHPLFVHTDYLFARAVVTNKVRARDLIR